MSTPLKKIKKLKEFNKQFQDNKIEQYKIENKVIQIFKKYNMDPSDMFNELQKHLKKSGERYVNKPRNKEETASTNELKTLNRMYKLKSDIYDKYEDLINIVPEARDLIKHTKGGKEEFKDIKTINDNIDTYVNELEQQDETTQQEHEQLKALPQATQEAFKLTDNNIKNISDILNDQGANIEDLRLKIDELEKTRISPRLRELIKDMSKQSDIMTTDKEELKKRLLTNHKDIITSEKVAEEAAKQIYNTAINNKVSKMKARKYLKRYADLNPELVEKLPDEYKELIDEETQQQYKENQYKKRLHYMLPKERPKWEKATTQYNINPMLGRGDR